MDWEIYMITCDVIDVYGYTVRELLDLFIPQIEQMQNPTDCNHYSQVC